MPHRALYSVRRVWTTATIVVAGLGLAVCAIGRSQVQSLLAQTTAEDQRTTELRRAVDARLISMLNQEVGLRGYLATGSAAFLVPYELGRKDGAAARQVLIADGIGADALVAENTAARRWQNEIAAPQISARASQTHFDLATALSAGKVTFGVYRQAHERLRMAFENGRLERMQRQNRRMVRVQLFAGAFAVMLVLFTSYISWLVLRRIIRPLVTLSQAAERGSVALGDVGNSSLREVVVLARTLGKLFAAVKDRSIRDGLTGAYDRGFLAEWLPRQLRLSRRAGKPFSALMVDLDHFKRINDTHGHEAGDRVLMATARCIERELRSTDVVVRYGGEEFTVLLPDTGAAGGAVTGERLRAALATMGEADGLPVGLRVTASIGAATVSDNDDVADLLGRADAALYEAKRGGRNRVVLARQTSASAKAAAGIAATRSPAGASTTRPPAGASTTRPPAGASTTRPPAGPAARDALANLPPPAASLPVTAEVAPADAFDAPTPSRAAALRLAS